MPPGYPSDAELRKTARDRVKQKGTYPDRKRPGGGSWDDVKGQGEVQRRYIGLMGERTVAILLGLPMGSDQGRRGDRRTNLVTANGVPVDVCTRTIVRQGQIPDLLRNATEKPRPELALVLVVWLGDHCEPAVLGWTWEHLVRERNWRVRYAKHESFSYSAADLFPFNRLKSSRPWVPPGKQLDLFGGTL